VEKMFDDILARDEKIIKVFKPNKKRYWKNLWFLAIPFFWPHWLMISALTLFSIWIWGPILFNKSYKNLFYAYTNKRLIVRSGAIGVDYQSLEYKDLTSTEVTVGYFDRKTKTGTISFRSPSVHGKPITFQNIEKPYEVLKEIQEYIDTNVKK